MPEPITPQLVMHLPRLSDRHDASNPSGRPAVTTRAFNGSDSDRRAWEKIIGESFGSTVSFAAIMERDPAFRPERVLFATVDGEPVATAAAWHRPKWGRRTGYLHMVGALPSHTGRGLGRAVCEAAVRRMIEENRFDSVLETDDFRLPAISLYLKMGYRPRLVAKSQIERWRSIFQKLDAAEKWADAPAFLTHALWPADQATVAGLEDRARSIDDEPVRAILRDQIEILRRLRDGQPAPWLEGAAPPVRGDTETNESGEQPQPAAKGESDAKAESDADTESFRRYADGRLREFELASIGHSLLDQLDRDEAPAPKTGIGNRPTVLDVRDFGARGDNRADDGPAFAAALAALCALPSNPAGRLSGVLRVPAGVYRIDGFTRPDHRAHLWIDGLENVSIEGDGPLASIIVGTRVGSILRMENCRNTTIRGIGFDLDPLPFTQGTVTSVDAQEQTIEWEAQHGWPGAPDWLPDHPFDPASDMAFGGAIGRDPATGRVLDGKHFPIKRIERLDERRARLTLRVPWFRDSLPFPAVEVGDGMTLHSRNIPGAQAALWLCANELCVFRDVGVYASWHHAVVVADNTAMRFIDCRIEPLPDTGRLAISNADGFHVRNNRIGPAFYGCSVRATADDTSNLYSKAASVLDQSSEKRIVIDVPSRPEYRATDWQTDPRSFRVGDLLAVLHSTEGTMDARGTITAVEETWWRGVPRLALTLSTRLPALVTRERLGKRHPVSNNMEFYRISEDVIAEHMVVNLALKSDAFVLRKNHFGENLINTMKLKASNGLIEGNTFDRPTAVGISLCMRLTWQEAFAPRNVLVRGNLFRGGSGIEATTDYPGGRFRHGPAYIDGIEIVNNRFEDLTGFGLRLANVNGMRVVGNSFEWADTAVDAHDAFSVHPTSCRIDFVGNTLNERTLTPTDLSGGELQPLEGSAGDTRGSSGPDSGDDTFSIGREVSR